MSEIELRRSVGAPNWGTTGKPDTCLWCGRKLHPHPYDPQYKGAYADNAFCSLRCGYCFGVTCAANGSRLKASPHPPAKPRRLPLWPKCPHCGKRMKHCESDHHSRLPAGTDGARCVCGNPQCDYRGDMHYVDSYETRRLVALDPPDPPP